MAEKFEATWEAEDGYVGGSRPHHVSIRADELDEDMDDEQLKNLFWEAIQSDFEQRCSPVSEDEGKFLEWAKEQIAANREQS